MKTAVKIGLCALLVSLVFPALARADEVASGDQIGRFIGSFKGSGWGKPALVLEVNLPPDSSAVTKIAVPNQDPMGAYDPNHVVASALEGAKPGDLLIIKTETDMGTLGIAKIGHYDAKPGEDEPGSFLFVDAHTDGEHPSVTLSRFNQIGIVPVATVRDETGKTVPDPAVLDAVKDFKKGDVVIAKLKTGRVPMLASLDAYTPPLTGEFVKLTSTLIDKQPHPAIEIKTDTGTDTVMLPGTTSKFGKFQVDPDLYSTVRRLRAKTPIEYRTKQDGDQTVLKDISPAKAAARGS